MCIEIKKLTPKLLDDYLDFFDNKAFVDNKKWSKCYCMYFHYDDDLKRIEKARKRSMSREFAIDYIKSGKLQGYLAYKDDEVVGWVNTNDKSAYATLNKDNSPLIWDEDNYTDKVKAVVCFLIARNMRGKKIATSFLDRICIDAVIDGYKRVEAYPLKGEHDCFSHYHGPLGLYEKCDFSIYKELDDKYIVRRELNAN